MPIAIVAVGLIVLSNLIAPPLTPQPVATGLVKDKVRVRYPVGKRPVIDLPNGDRRMVQSLLNVRKQMEFGDFVWNDDGVAGGTVWVRIDLARQMLSVFRADQEIGSAVILYGTDGKPTPTGVFPVLEKAEKHSSNLYDAEMPYMLRLTNDGVAIHASNVRFGAATHGCIGIPIEFAKLLFAQVKRGDLVAIVATGT